MYTTDMDNTQIEFNYKNFSSLSPQDRKDFKSFINSQLNENVLDMPFGAKIYCVIHGLKEPEPCMECLSNPRNWQNKNFQFGKFCSRTCTDIASKYGSNYDNYVRKLTCNLNLIEYYNKNVKGNSLVKLHLKEPEFYSGLIQTTDHLAIDASLSCRIWHLVNGSVKPTCSECDAHVSWDETHGEYNKYCSPKCANNSKEKINIIKTTLQDKYGIDNALKLPNAVRNLRKYQDTLVSTPTVYAVAEPEWQSVHGVDHIMHVPAYAQQVGRNRQNNLYGDDTTDILNNPVILQTLHHTDKKSLTDIGNMLGIPAYTISKTFSKYNISVKNYYSSTEENEVADFIRTLTPDVRQNVRDIIAGEIDVYVPLKNIAIEYCGLYWHSNLYKDNLYHYNKWKKCNDVGIRLITIFQNEWKYNKDLLKKKLSHIFGSNSDRRIFARNTTVVELNDTTLIKEFLNTYHIQGYVGGSKQYGLLNGNELVAVMILKQEGNILNLTRFATSLTVVGGFSKLLKFVKTEHPNISIKTFADLRWDTGAIYENNGFVFDGIIKPDYYYIRNDKLYHKFNFRHKQLSKLSGYDATLSESENTAKMNIHKIYDCGKKRFILEV